MKIHYSFLAIFLTKNKSNGWFSQEQEKRYIENEKKKKPTGEILPTTIKK